MDRIYPLVAGEERRGSRRWLRLGCLRPVAGAPVLRLRFSVVTTLRVVDDGCRWSVVVRSTLERVERSCADLGERAVGGQRFEEAQFDEVTYAVGLSCFAFVGVVPIYGDSSEPIEVSDPEGSAAGFTRTRTLRLVSTPWPRAVKSVGFRLFRVYRLFREW